MKKVLFFVLAAFVSATVSAQVVTSTSFKKAKSSTVWYVKAGANIANISVEHGEGYDALFGYNVGIAFDSPIGGSGVFWNSGLQLATKGYKDSDDDQKVNINKLEIPLTFGYKYKVNDDISIDARAGGFANYHLFGKARDSSDLGEFEDRISAGIQFGVGVWYQKLNFNITYQNGLVEENGKEKNWMFSLGYAF
ncbi:MAG: porin family protein [Prevotellaceae bacterium]|jgi:hypothetical protein|nr:porin family protein [Prevotellaceae bacterium]